MTSPTSPQKGPLRCCCSQVWVTNGGRIPWNTAAICETFKISCLMGKTPHERRFGIPQNGPVIPFGAVVEYTLSLRKTCRDYISLVQKSCQFFRLRLNIACGWNLDRDIMVADSEELEEMDASELHAGFNAKEVLTPKRS